jgi:tetratricopeptide (TPR) repeat protein
LNNVAALYYSQRKFSDAERQVRRALEKNPESATLRFNLRAARYARENAKNARDIATGLEKQNPTLVEKREGDILQMQILMQAKDLEEAVLHERRGDSFFARKLYEDAIIEYKKAIAIDRYNASTLNRLGLVYHQSQKLNDAERYYREAIKQNPYFLEVLNNIGTVEYARQRYRKRVGAIRKGAENQARITDCAAEHGRLPPRHEAIRRGAPCYPACDRNRSQNPGQSSGFGTLIQTSRRADPMVSFYFAKIYAGQGDKERAISYLNRALDEGFKEYDKIKTEKAFAVLAADEGYLKLLDRIAALSASNTQDR